MSRLVVSNTDDSLAMAPQGRYWMITIPKVHLNEPIFSGEMAYMKGQEEIGEGGLNHWQILVIFKKALRLTPVKAHFVPQAHCELSRSAAANDYVWKDETSVPGTRFEHGRLPIQRGSVADWDAVRRSAESGDFKEIPSDILIRNYGNLKRLRVDAIVPQFRTGITVNVYWGLSGTGKTRRAWHEAGDPADVFIKDPNTKWWDGYRGQKKVIIDEFTGLISISHLLRWIDRYPVIAEVKGYSLPLEALEFWITSNVDPRDWYSDINDEQRRALLRRFTSCVHFLGNWAPPTPEIPSFDLDSIFADLA